MDSVDVCAATSTGDNKRQVNKKNRDWLNRLHHRKAAVQPQTMQSADKHGPKKIARAAAETVAAEERTSTLWPSSKKLRSQEAQERTIKSGKTLRFNCSQCTDNAKRTPKDLLKHFEEKHRGIPPVFPCPMCNFTTHEYSYLQVHLLSHKDTFSCCSICNDNIQRTWAEFSTHLTMVHTQNGKYTCEICKKFTTSHDKEFLEHMLLHNLGLDQKSEHAIGKSRTLTHSCQYCGYEVSQKILLTKHIKAIHGSVNCDQKNNGVNAFAVKPCDPKCKPRLTRSAVNEACWLTQDCLSLPGREFLDKYCHLTDAQTTLEETEQFLMKSGKPKWTKALQNVLSNVTQDTTRHPKAENGIASVFPDSSQDVTVLTVKNKLTHGASFVKRLKMITEKEMESANADLCAVEKVVSDANLNDCLHIQEIKLNSDILIAETPEGPQMEENRENQRLKTHLNEQNLEQPIPGGGITNELKAEERKAVHKAIPKKKRKNMRWKNMKSKKAVKDHSTMALKIVFKKNPETGKQWVTQSALSPTKCNSTINEVTLAEKKCNQTMKMDVCEGNGTMQDQQEADGIHSQISGTTNMAAKMIAMLQDGGNLGAEVESRLANGTLEKCQDRSETGPDFGESDDLKTAHNSSTEASPLTQPVITPQSLTANLAISSLPVVDGTPESVPTGASLGSSLEKSQSSAFHWNPVPKNLERTLHLFAINPNQLVKRPLRDQPVVVLNHPDADIPEVARIMEVVSRYKGEVHKVVMSKRTLNALSALNGEAVSPLLDNTHSNPGRNGVRERFLLKLKLRRLSRKKFEVVNADTSTSYNVEAFRCWFCGRAFESRETWLFHRQRHMMEWKSPNCENS